MRDQHELALQCLEVEQSGGNVLEYLKSLGYISQKATWERLQLNELGRKPGKFNGGVKTLKRMTLEFKKKVVEFAISGGDPLEKIRAAGIKNAGPAWYTIKKNLKETDPELYAKIPERPSRPGPKPRQKEQKTATVKVSEPVEDKPAQKITKPLCHSGLKAIGWGGEFGKYIYDEKNGFLDVDMVDGDLISMKIEEWQRFLKELRDAAALMGVEL